MNAKNFDAFWKSTFENQVQRWDEETAKEAARVAWQIGCVFERRKIVTQLDSCEAIKDIFS